MVTTQPYAGRCLFLVVLAWVAGCDRGIQSEGVPSVRLARTFSAVDPLNAADPRGLNQTDDRELPEAWKTCSADTDCIVIRWGCGGFDAVTSTFVERAVERNRLDRMAMECGAPEPGIYVAPTDGSKPSHVGRCFAKQCVAMDVREPRRASHR